MIKKCVLALAIALALAVPIVRADTINPAVSIDPTQIAGNEFNDGPWLIGWEFSTNTAVGVNYLGAYVSPTYGMTQSVDVGIYDSSGDLLVSAVVSPGDTIVDNFAYVSIPTYTLAAGQTYTIVATWGTDYYVYLPSPNDYTTSPEINFIQDLYDTSNGTLGIPTQTDGPGTYAAFGPNFDADTISDVPEPATMSLFLLGAASLLGAGVVRRRK